MSNVRAHVSDGQLASACHADMPPNKTLQPTLDSPFVLLPQLCTARLSAAELGC